MAIDRRSSACGMGSTSIICPPCHRRIRWRTKHYLSVAMVGALVVIALVAAISISLAPAHLTFSIAAANVAIYGPLVNNHHRNNTHLNFTLAVDNSSPRTAVWYGRMTGEISYGPATTAWVRYGFQESDVWQEPNSTACFNFSVDYGYDENTLYAVDSCRILMVSKVRFAWLGLRTLPYTVRFSCEPVNFVDNKNFPIRCA
ncbi:uncharacterized protein [Miscanthus floridulus]|uniref:uncharacterized protein n=1 Tax=Miscanthus floridulus TaxID=154761 RepID=UPI00345A12D6